MKTLLIKLLIDLVGLLLLWKILTVPLPDYVFIVLILISLSLLSAYKSMLGFFDAFQALQLFLIFIFLGAVHTVLSDTPTVILINLYALSFVLLLGLRLGFFAYRNKHLINAIGIFRYKSNSAVIVGAGEATAIFIAQKIALDYDILAIFDDNLGKKGRRMAGVEIVGTLDDLFSFMQKNQVLNVIYMIPSVNIEKHKPTFNRIQKAFPRTEFLSAPSLNDINGGLKNLSELSNLNLLAVNDSSADSSLHPTIVKKLIGQTIFVTGGAGSIGRTLTESLLNLDQENLIVVLDKDESAAYELSESFQAFIDQGTLIVHLGDYGDITCVKDILNKYQPAFIYHAGAYKHVNLLENVNVYSAINNNCIKSIRLAREIKNHPCVKNFVLVSTDKAVHPSNIMGLSKRIVEISLSKVLDGSPVSLITVRFGNVVGSNGSAFHKFLRQIQSRQKITLTDRSVTRFFMNINQAANLIIKASLIGSTGKVYILNMGEPVKVYDFIISMITKYGSKDQVNDIMITGLKPGEKMDEELFYDHENIQVLDKSIFVGNLATINFDVEAFESFFEKVEITDEKAIKAYLDQIKIQ